MNKRKRISLDYTPSEIEYNKRRRMSLDYTPDEKEDNKKMYTRWGNKLFDYSFDKDKDGLTEDDKEYNYMIAEKEKLLHQYNNLDDDTKEKMKEELDLELEKLEEESRYDPNYVRLVAKDLSDLFGKKRSKKPKRSKKNRKTRKTRKTRNGRVINKFGSDKNTEPLLLARWNLAREEYKLNKTNENLDKYNKADKDYVDYLNNQREQSRIKRSKSFVGRLINKTIKEAKLMNIK